MSIIKGGILILDWNIVLQINLLRSMFWRRGGIPFKKNSYLESLIFLKNFLQQSSSWPTELLYQPAI